ncbi:hypothetical protein FQN60_013183 [Etheostoma spectabile]|uniref:Glutamine amidotransferase type-2 domain-containing protein n=1 Tax=Etheostoma spectabile TaxID=54343 RepID=A0A5J5D544_9PERO|nr:hypothetical protein FQN60_013183 [Etheostoma spectabile]
MEFEASGIGEECGVFGCVAAGEWPTQLEVAQVLTLGLVALQHSSRVMWRAIGCAIHNGVHLIVEPHKAPRVGFITLSSLKRAVESRSMPCCISLLEIWTKMSLFLVELSNCLHTRSSDQTRISARTSWSLQFRPVSDTMTTWNWSALGWRLKPPCPRFFIIQPLLHLQGPVFQSAVQQNGFHLIEELHVLSRASCAAASNRLRITPKFLCIWRAISWKMDLLRSVHFRRSRTRRSAQTHNRALTSSSVQWRPPSSAPLAVRACCRVWLPAPESQAPALGLTLPPAAHNTEPPQTL